MGVQINQAVLLILILISISVPAIVTSELEPGPGDKRERECIRRNMSHSHETRQLSFKHQCQKHLLLRQAWIDGSWSIVDRRGSSPALLHTTRSRVKMTRCLACVHHLNGVGSVAATIVHGIWTLDGTQLRIGVSAGCVCTHERKSAQNTCAH